MHSVWTLLGSSVLFRLVSSELFPTPNLQWSLQLEGSGPRSGRGLRRGNAIVAHKDGTKIVATAGDGSLHIIETTDTVRTLAVFDPSPMDGRDMECMSSPVLVDSASQSGLWEEGSPPTESEWIVYAVVDTLFSTTTAGEISTNLSEADSPITSRVMAVDMEGNLQWSVLLPGKIEGTPVVGKKAIFASHNENGRGKISVLKIQADGTAKIVTTVSPAVSGEELPPPLGPPALQTGSMEDRVVVAESWDSGFSQTRGGMHLLSLVAHTKGKDEELLTPATYELVRISSWSSSAMAPPLVFGDSIYLGAAGGTIAGFTGDRRNDLSGITEGRESDLVPRWDYQVTPNPRDASQPLRSQPMVDSSGEFLFVPGVATDFYAVRTNNGREAWRVNQGSQTLARPQTFEDENNDRTKVVYVIEVQQGRVTQYDMFNGRRYWDYSCADISNQMCQDAVEADFAILPNGNTIYYGDIYGRINALDVANYETGAPSTAPTIVPTMSPSVAPSRTTSPAAELLEPTAKPTTATATPSLPINVQEIDSSSTNVNAQPPEDPSAVLNQQAAGQNTSSSSAKTGVYVGATIAVLCFLLAGAILFSMLRRKKKKTKASDDLVVEIIDDFSSGDDGEDDVEFEVHTNAADPDGGDGIEVEFISSTVTPIKKKKKKKHKDKLRTPDTVDTLASIDERTEDGSARLVTAESYDVEDQSVEAVNLRQTFEKVVDKRAPTVGDVHRRADSNHLEIAVGNQSNESFDSETGVVPPPPPEDHGRSPKEWTWGSLLQKGTSEASPSPSTPSVKELAEKLELKTAGAMPVSPSPKETIAQKTVERPREDMNLSTDTTEAMIAETGPDESFEEPKIQPPTDPLMMEEGAVEKEQANEDEEKSQYVQSRSQTPVPSEQERQASPAVTPTRSTHGSAFGTPHESPTYTIGSDDDSLYTSYTSATRDKKEKKKDLSPLSNFANYVYDQEIQRRGRSELLNETKLSLAPPVLDEEDHPDDEPGLIPGNKYLGSASLGTDSSKYGKSVRSKKDSNVFRSEPSGHTPLAEMYDQLAAIGQQRREEKKPAFKRRQRETHPVPIPAPEEERTTDTWGSFLNELAEAEKSFFSPAVGKSKSLLNEEDAEDPELANINKM